jgi:L-ribulose-5-phosphate 3-epimerase
MKGEIYLKNLVCLHSNTYHGFSLDEALVGASKAGFRYIELTAVAGYTEHVRSDMNDAELNEVKRKLATHGIECIGLSGHSNLMDNEGTEVIAQNIDLAHRLNCKYFVTSTGEAHGDHDVIEDEKVLVERLQPLVDKCQKYGLTFVIETHGNNYATGHVVKNLVQKVGSDAIGVNYDTGNVIIYGKTEPYDDLEQSADAVSYIHLKDKDGKPEEWNFPAIGRGKIDFTQVFNILERTGCEAPLSVEIEFTPAGPSGVEEVHEAVQYSYQTIQKLKESR